MTLQEYFKQEQPISDRLIEDTALYADVATILFGDSDLGYGAIKIAHVGENLWALGYEIKACVNAKLIYKECTANDITKGCINNLVYGMTKVLSNHLKAKYNNLKLKKLLLKSTEEAAKYYVNNVKEIGKITI